MDSTIRIDEPVSFKLVKATKRIIFDCQIGIWQVPTRGPYSYYIYTALWVYTQVSLSAMSLDAITIIINISNDVFFYNNYARTIITL